MTTDTMTAQAPARTGRPARFTDTLRSEWAKLFSLRSTYITLALGVFLSIGLSALLALAVGTTFDDWTAAQQADFDPALYSLSGILIAGIAFSVFGVLAASSEYSSGMIRLSLTVTPRRWRLLAAKIVVVTIVTLVLGVVTTLGMFFAGQVMFEAYDMPTVTLADADAQRAVFGVGATMPFFPVIGLAFGVLLRSTAGGITAILALIWVPEVFSGLLPRWWQENILSALPGAALDSATIGRLVDSPTYRDPAVGVAIAAAWLAAFVGAAYLSLVRRDA